MNRRRLLRLAGLGSAALLAGCFGDDSDDPSADNDTDNETDPDEEDIDLTELEPDEAADTIVDWIDEPTFSDQEFDVTEYGAVDDGETDASEAFTDAIADCTDAGGGRVIVPDGEYFHAGPIHLESDVNLHVTPQATVRFSTNSVDYLPVVRTWWEGNELMGHSPLIYAHEAENIAITGGGTFDAQAEPDVWWRWQDSEDDDATDLIEMNDDEVPIEDREFGIGTNLRPPFVQPVDCERVLIEDVTLLDSPFWFINLPLCEDVVVRNVTTDGQGPNNDGCNPEFAKNVLIENCTFDNGDDNVALKAGRNEDGRRIGISTENVVVQDCEMRQGHGCVVAGSEMSAGVEKVYARRNVLNSPDLAWALRIKTNSYRGGFVRDWYFWDNEIEEIDPDGQHVRINMLYQTRDALPSPSEVTGDYVPDVHNINVENVTSDGEAPLFYLKGLEESPIEDLTIEGAAFSQAPLGSWNANVEDLTIRDSQLGFAPPETSTELLKVTQPSPSRFGMTFENVTDADGDALAADQPYLSVTTAEVGTEYYVDREYVIDDLPEHLEGTTLIRGKNDDTELRSEDLPEYLTFEATEDVVVHTAFHPDGEDEWWPKWRSDWERADDVSVSDPNLEDGHYVTFRNTFEAGEITLGPNDSTTGSASSYVTFVDSVDE